MYPKRCAECGGPVEASTASVPFEVRGECVEVPGIEHGVCRGCSEIFLPLDEAEKLQVEAIRISKAAKRLLSPAEIRELRLSLSMSQVAFEELLGVGAKTVVRWEKGTVFQSATADRLMRLIRLIPELKDVLCGGELYGEEAPIPPLLEDIAAAEAQLAAGEGISHSEAKARVLASIKQCR